MEQFTVEVEDKGRVTIPARLRRDLGITKGDELEVSAKGGAIILKRKRVVSVDDIHGSIGHFVVEIRDIKDAAGRT